MYQEIHSLLLQEASTPTKASFFVKTGPGQYAEHDRFLGVRAPVIRTAARRYENIGFEDLQSLIDSPFNEELSLALHIAVRRYQKRHKEWRIYPVVH